MGHMDRYYVCGSLMFIAHINVIICHLIALVTELQNSEDSHVVSRLADWTLLGGC